MFEQHGNFHLETQGHTIIFTACGAWNMETSIACISGIQRITDGFNGAPFNVIMDSLAFEGLTSDCIDVWVNEIESWLSSNLIAVCRIDDPDSPGYRIYLTAFDQIFKNRIPFSFANNTQEALAWIEKVSGNQATG